MRTVSQSSILQKASASRRTCVVVRASATPRPAPQGMRAAAAAAAAAIFLFSQPAFAGSFASKIAQDEALIDSAQTRLEAALNLQLNKAKAEQVGKKQEIEKKAGELANRLEAKITQDAAEIKALEARAESDREAKKRKEELQKELTEIVNVESKLNQEVKAAQDAADREALIAKARITQELQQKAKAVEAVKEKLEVIKTQVESNSSLTPKQVDQEAEAINQSINKWIDQFAKLN